MSTQRRFLKSVATLFWTVAMISLAAGQAPAGQVSDSSDETRLRQAYVNLPLTFEANEGQTDGKVRFLSCGGGYVLFLTSEEAVLSLRRPSVQGAGPESGVQSPGSTSHDS